MHERKKSTAMEDRKNYYRQINNSYRLSSSLIAQTLNSDADGEEFEEEDIWGLDSKDYRFKSHETHISKVINRKPRENGNSNSSTTPRRLPTGSRMIPRSTLNDEIISTSSWRPQSAPINIPDWTQIYSRKKSEPVLERGMRNPLMEDEDIEDEDEEKGDDDGIIPPHELVARQYARSQMTPFSMCEGAGRTLKGRDLSRVRNAVLTRTGFLE